jgi:nucleotide-binding universal stress UspA family protein
MSTTQQPAGPRMVVGVDGSLGSNVALAWAAAAAEALGADLVAVRAYPMAEFGEGFEDLTEYATAELSQQLTQVLGAAGAAKVSQVIDSGDADHVLLRHCEGAELVVTGSHGHSRLAHLGLGSTAEDVLRHAPCPVVVVREDPDAEPGPEAGRVVVAVDVTRHSQPTLGFGFHMASATGRPLTVLHAWHPPFRRVPGRAAPHADADRALQEEERKQLAEAVADWAAKYHDVEVRHAAVPGDVVPTVLAASAGADLLVVGGHRRTLPGSLSLGAVAHAAVHHAYCPVAVVARTTDEHD